MQKTKKLKMAEYASVLICRTLRGTFLFFVGKVNNTCKVLHIDPFTGQVLHGVADSFSSENDALVATFREEDLFLERRRVSAVLGLHVSFNSVLLFVATKTRSVSMPGASQQIHVVVQSDTIEIPLLLQNEHLLSVEMQHNILEMMQKYPFDETHFFSYTMDVTRPFGPPLFATDTPMNPAYAWNDFLRAPFVQEGLGSFCPVLAQGYCGSRRVSVEDGAVIHMATLCRRSAVAPEFEVDFLCWSGSRFCCFTSRRSLAPHISSKDYLSVYFESLADQIRRAQGGDVLLDPNMCLISLDGELEMLSSALETAMNRTLCGGNVFYRAFDWPRACKMHSGKSEGAAGELWNVIGMYLKSLSVTECSLKDDGSLEAVHSIQNGMLIAMSEDGLKNVSEFMLYFSLLVSAELLRRVLQVEGEAWEGLGMTPSLLCSSVLDMEVANAVAALSVECSDAVTFILAHRESLFTSEVGAFLPISLLSPLHRKVGEVIGTLSETERKMQETIVALLRKSCFSKRVRLTRGSLFHVSVNGTEIPLTEPTASAEKLVVSGLLAGVPSVMVDIPLYQPAAVTHWCISFPFMDEAPRPSHCDVFLGGKCVMFRVELPRAIFVKGGGSQVAMIFKLPPRAWEMYGFLQERERSQRVEDSVIRFVFYKASIADTSMQLGVISVFGSVGVAVDAASARSELWRMQVMHSMKPVSSIVRYVLNNTASALGDARMDEGGQESLQKKSQEDSASESAKDEYLEAAKRVDDTSLLALLKLESRRISLGISQDERDLLLYVAGLNICAYDPRKLLGSRDKSLEDLLRAAVPSSFMSCASGSQCRSKDGFTLSIARNKPCHQCRKRFCSKCIEEVMLLESRVSSMSQVCFACRAKIDEEKELLLELQRSEKFAEVRTESSEEIAFRHLTRLCTAVAEAKHDYGHYPFVRASSVDWRLNMLFLPTDALPLSFFWESDSKDVDFSVFLPFRSVLNSATLFAPPDAPFWNTDNLEVTLTLANGTVLGKAKLESSQQTDTIGVACACTEPTSMVRVHLTSTRGSFRVARLSFGLFRHVDAIQGVPANNVDHASSLRNVSLGAEVFGKKGKKESIVLPLAVKPLVVQEVQDMIRCSLVHQKIFEPIRREHRGNVSELWFVRQRNSVTFPGGGLIVRVKREAMMPQQLRLIRVTAVVADDRGDVVSAVALRDPIVVPQIPGGTTLWFSLPATDKLSCLNIEFILDVGRPEVFVTITTSN